MVDFGDEEVFDMKSQETKEKFIQLRAEGRSFDSIANELSTSKTTLIKWSREFDREINNAQYFASQSLIEQYKITKRERIKYITKELEKIYNALGQKDYNELSVKDLIFLKEKFEDDLKKELVNIEYRTGEFIKIDHNNLNLFDSSQKSEITVKLE